MKGESRKAAPQEKQSRDPETWIQRPMKKYRSGKGMMEFRPDHKFFAFADPVIESGRTLLGYDRLYVFWQAIRNLRSVPGNAAEVGSFRGGSAFFIAGALLDATGEEVPLDVFDTFEGHPGAALSEQDTHHRQEGLFGGTDYDDVKAYLAPFQRTRVHKGDVLLALPSLPEASYRLVHIDTDLYLPTRACLEYFAPRLSPGGIIVVDDYSSAHCPGVQQAAAEFVGGQQDAWQVWDHRTKQLIMAKR